ncbi:MAG: pilus assembly protein PilM [Phycisphaerae bacterium]
MKLSALLTSRPQPIGLDLASAELRLLQLRLVDGLPVLVSAARRPVPQEPIPLRQGKASSACVLPPRRAEILVEMIRQQGFFGRRIVAAIPEQITRIKNIRLPSMPPEETAEAALLEAPEALGFAPDEAAVRHLVLGTVRQGNDARQEIMVFGARHIDIDLFTEELHRCGLQVAGLDFEPAAIYRIVERFLRRDDDLREVHVVVSVGSAKSRVIIGRGADITFCKTIELGGSHVHAAVARKLGVSLEEARALRKRFDLITDPQEQAGGVRQAVEDAARSTFEMLAREIALCMRYHSVTFRGTRPGLVRVVGAEGDDKQLLEVLNQQLPVRTELARPLDAVGGLTNSPVRDETQGRWALAMGLGLRKAKGPFAPADGTTRQQQAVLAAEEQKLQAAADDAGHAARRATGASAEPEVARA